MMRVGMVKMVFVVAVMLAHSVLIQAQEDPTTVKGIKVAVITNAGGMHLGAYYLGLAKSADVSSVVLSDPHGTAEKMARSSLGDKLTAVYKNRDEMLAKEKPVMALITMAADRSPEAIDAALDAGCHVMAEKPGSLRAEDFAPLVAKAKAKNLHLMLALANRLNPEFLKAKQLVADGVIGRVYNVQLNLIEDQTRLTRKSYQESWLADKSKAGGGHLTWLAIHWLDLSMYITDSSITHVAGFTANVGGQPINIEDSVALSLRYDNGSLGTLSSGYFLDKGYQAMLKVWGEKGWLEITSDSPRQVRWYSTASGTPVSETFDGDAGHVGYTVFVQACVRASVGLGEAPITGEESLRVLKVVYGAYDAVEQEKTVAVDQ